MEALGFTKHARRTFHDVPYLLTVSGDNDNLSIEVEHAEDGRRWRSKFAARFIEEITQRTGNAKKFDVFVRMMLSALVQESDSVYIDVLTARDLEMLRRHANPQGPPSTSTAGQSDKRYLILTYRAEFDKVHYPLPLPLDERSEEEKLRAMVGRLQAELAEARQTITSLELKAPGAEPGAADALQRQNAELSEALRAARREVDQLRAEFRQRPGPAAAGADSNEVHKLRAQCNKLQAELKAAKDDTRQKEAQHKQRERELRAEKQKVEKLQQQVRKLEEERRSSGLRLPNAERRPSAERSRPASRTPSAERARPPSRPASRPPSRTVSRPGSRASSVASSRERTPSPSGLINRSGAGARGNSGNERPWAFNNRSGSPADRASRSGGRTASPTATLSPYRRQAASLGGSRRTPSPGTRSRERTPSPGHAARGAGAGGAGGTRPPVSLRDRGGPGGAAAGGVPAGGGAGASGSSRLVRPSSSTRPGGGSRPASASRSGGGGRLCDSLDGQGGDGRAGSRGPSGRTDEQQHRPGALFGLAANLGIGPGSLAVASSASSSGTALQCAGAEEAEACDIDARLQALQSFLKQTKHIAT